MHEIGSPTDVRVTECKLKLVQIRFVEISGQLKVEISALCKKILYSVVWVNSHAKSCIIKSEKIAQSPHGMGVVG